MVYIKKHVSDDAKKTPLKCNKVVTIKKRGICHSKQKSW